MCLSAFVSPSFAGEGEGDVAARLKVLEDANRKLAEQCAELLKRDSETRRVSDERYRDLERRYESLQGRIEEKRGRESTSEPPDAETETRGPLRGISTAPGPSRLTKAESNSSGIPEREFARVPLKANFHDGFELSTPDDEVSLRFHALSQVDFKDFVPNTQSPARSGLYIPRVRLYLEGDLTRLFDYEVSLQRSVEGAWDLLDANLDFKPSEKFQVRFGRTIVPYSYDWYDHLEQYFISPERGLFPLNFGLSRSAGILAQGLLSDGRVQYAVGGFDGRLTGVADNNNTRDAVGYVNVRPFLNTKEWSALRFLNVGGSGFLGQQIEGQIPLPLRTSIQSSENDEAAKNASAVFLMFNNGVTALGARSAGALHAAWYRKQLSFEGEWQIGSMQFVREGQDRRVSLPVSGYHIGMSYFLTGEEVENRSVVEPLRPFSLRPGKFGPGAFELFARYNRLELGREVFSQGLANADLWTRKVDMTDFGFNWYPNRFLKFYVDWQTPMYGTPVTTDPATGRSLRNGSLFWIRCQIYF